MSVTSIRNTQSNYAIPQSQTSAIEVTAEKVSSLEPSALMQQLIPAAESPKKRKRTTSPILGSPMGLPITSPEKRIKYGKIIAPHPAHNPSKFDNTRNEGCEMRKFINTIRGKKNGHTWTVRSPLKFSPTHLNPDIKGRIDFHGRRYIVHESPTKNPNSPAVVKAAISAPSEKKREKRLYPILGPNLIRQEGEDAANTLLAYRRSGSTETFEQYLIRTCTKRARQNLDDPQDLETGIDFMSPKKIAETEQAKTENISCTS